MKDATLKRLAYVFGFISAVLIVIALLAVRNIRLTSEASDWVNHTHALINRIDNTRSGLLRSEAALRAYTATGDSGDLLTLNRALGDMLSEVEIAQLMTDSDTEPEQYSQLQEIGTLCSAHIELSRRIIAARQTGDAITLGRELDALNRSGGGAAIEQRLAYLKARLLVHLSEHDTQLYLQVQSTRWAIWSGVVLDLFLLGSAGWLIRDDFAHRRRAATALEEANAQLEIKVQERTAELRAANHQLSLDNLERQWANQALEHQLHYNHRIVECVSDLVIVLTKAGRITRVNTAVLRFSGWETVDLVQESFDKVLRLGEATPSEVGTSRSRDVPSSSVQNTRIATAMKDGRDLVDQPGFALTYNRREAPAFISLYPLRDQNKVIGGILTLRLIGEPS